MKIVQISPGSGDNFYCENCLRDAALVKAARKLGHDVLMVPLYLPLQADKTEQVSNAPIFFGGVNVFLQQKLALFRRTPRWIDKVFDSRKLLEWAGRKAGMTSARDLGETTIWKASTAGRSRSWIASSTGSWRPSTTRMWCVCRTFCWEA